MTLLAMRTKCIAFDYFKHFVVSDPARKNHKAFYGVYSA